MGPFSKYGSEVAEACLAAGCHYTDTTGEQDWVLDAKTRFGPKFAEKSLLLSPGIAQMYTTGEIAANICLETPALDTLDILVLWKGFPSYASTQTIFAILQAKWYYLEQNKYVEWAQNTHFEVNVPGQHAHALVTPWTGTSHPVWFKDDPRVANCKAVGGVFAREVMEGFVATQKMFEEQIKPLPPDQQQSALAKIAASIQGGMPPRENPRINILLIRSMRQARWRALIASSTVSTTTNRPAFCKPTPPIPYCSSRLRSPDSPRPARHSAIAAFSACSRASGSSRSLSSPSKDELTRAPARRKDDAFFCAFRPGATLAANSPALRHGRDQFSSQKVRGSKRTHPAFAI